MSIITQTTTTFNDGGVTSLIISWATMTTGDSGDPVTRSAAADRSIQVIGTAAGGTLSFQGSNDGTNWQTLHDPQGNLLDFTGEGIKAISEATYYVRPLITGGAGTSMTCVLYAKVGT